MWRQTAQVNKLQIRGERCAESLKGIGLDLDGIGIAVPKFHHVWQPGKSNIN